MFLIFNPRAPILVSVFSSGDSMCPMEIDISESLTVRPLVYEVPLRMWLKRKGTSQGEE